MTQHQELPHPERAPSRAHVETRLLYGRLRALKPGDLVTYDDLSAEIGKDVRRVSWHHLSTAREWLEKDDRIVTECDPGTGVRRLTNEEHTAAMQMHRKRAQGQVWRGLHKGACADYEKLARDARREFNREIGHLGLLNAVTSEKASKALDAVSKPDKAVSSAEAMKAVLAAET